MAGIAVCSIHMGIRLEFDMGDKNNDTIKEPQDGGVDDGRGLRLVDEPRVVEPSNPFAVRQRPAASNAPRYGAPRRGHEQSEEAKQFAAALRQRWHEWGFD